MIREMLRAIRKRGKILWRMQNSFKSKMTVIYTIVVDKYYLARKLNDTLRYTLLFLDKLPNALQKKFNNHI